MEVLKIRIFFFFFFFYNTWKFAPFYHLLLTPPPPLPLLGTTNPTSLSVNLTVSGSLKYNWPTILWQFMVTMQQFDISIHFKLITIIALVPICHRTKISYYSWTFSSLCTLHTCDIYFITGSLYLLISLMYFIYSRIPILWQLSVCSVSMTLSALY